MFRKYASENIVIFDGAMGTSIQNFDIDDSVWQDKAGCSEWLNVAAPEIVEAIHRSYFKAGADVVETNTFGGTELVMKEYGLEDRVDELNLEGARIARRVADEFGKFCAGSIGPGTKLPSLGQISFDDLRLMYGRQCEKLIEGGVDLLIIETCQDLLQIKAAVNGAMDAKESMGSDLPVMVSITVESTGSMLMGTDLTAVCAVLRDYPLYSVGLNCATGPDMMFGPLKTISEGWDRDISCIPNAGLPENIGGKTVYSMTPEKLATIVSQLMDKYPVNIIGGCCGTTPEHIQALRKMANGRRRNEPSPIDYQGTCASLYSAMNLSQSPAPGLIGERANANGSKAFRELLLAEDFDGMLAVARNQEAEGAHFIDACVAYAGRDEAKDMKRFMFDLNKSVTVPVVIDSTEPDVLETAMKLYGGKPVINSINYEDGGEKLHTILKLIKRMPAASIALTINEEGMAMTADEKFDTAKRLYDVWTGEYSLPPEDLIIDPLTFSIGSGDEKLKNAALATLEAIRRIKAELPGAKTVLGLSNVSFGLSKESRPVLNSVFLHEAVEAGLDMAIVHASKILPPAAIDYEDRKLSLALINGEDNALTEFIEHFQNREGIVKEAEPEDLSDEERLERKIMGGEKKGLEEVLDTLMETHPPIDIINNLMLPAMQKIGDLFGEGKMLLPFVLQSAEVMKQGVKHLEPFMERKEGDTRGKIVLATVKGDVHDIGKNLVEIILSNNGYTVHNLGIKVPVEEMIESAIKEGADAIGMSGLLVKSTVIMKENIEELKRQGLDTKIMLGGAALTKNFVEDQCDTVMPGKVFYCRDAFDALKVLDGSAEAAPKPEKKSYPKPPSAAAEKTPIHHDQIPEAPFLGTKVEFDIDPHEVGRYLNRQLLFSSRWSYKKKGLSTEQYADMMDTEIMPEFDKAWKTVMEKSLLNPAVTYGYFPCKSRGDSLDVYSEDKSEVIKTFEFPRQKGGAELCLADYFSPDSFDLLPLQLVTIGRKPEEFCKKLYEEDNYKRYYIYHGLFVELTEALAEYWHKVMRSQMDIDKRDAKTPDGIIGMQYQGKRYSFGYPACPDLMGNADIAEMLEADILGISVTENGEMVPEFSTSAIIVHNDAARYFNVR
ncbi:methionine synthase [Limisalsivibrio acetivorans]|uniref:methionine synthase n=1 Tax=Limisalsivibrio acetivorans TaxID=1304888 RepID=UPI0003B30738|nr:methionine synthase [Limisalsivibrio acetivorans]